MVKRGKKDVKKGIILGIWDGHDSGAAILDGADILFAVNEERLTRRKLEIAFPTQSILLCLKETGLSPSQIKEIAISTWDFSKTLTRVFPHLKEEYYLIRRRKKLPGIFTNIKKMAKYRLTEVGPSSLYEKITRKVVNKELFKLGFSNYNLHLFNHHFCHATSCAFASQFDKALVITLDGIGDGLSGSISLFEEGKIKPISYISGKDSLGVFFEHVTNLLNMRELEDEGKVMALANYAYPVDDSKNPLINFFDVNGVNLKARYSSIAMYYQMKKILWLYPPEQFANMAQRALEVFVTKLVENGIKKTATSNIAMAGGVFSNIKINMLIKDMENIDKWFVFPHMGDGGLALGAAFALAHKLYNISSFDIKDLMFGPKFSDKEIESELKNKNLKYRYIEDIEKETANRIAKGEIILWFQGRMEIGPRALGARSILALPNNEEIKDRLNLHLKKRVWYQPFCPSMLKEDALELLENYNGEKSPYMTMGYMVKKEKLAELKGVINVDGSCRPQIVDDDKSRYGKLLRELKKITGRGVVLNTSFNIHGEPIVCTPLDAIRTFETTGFDALVIENYLVEG